MEGLSVSQGQKKARPDVPGGIKYREIPPHVALRPYVRCFWELNGSLPFAAPAGQTFISDGAMELFFNLGAPFELLTGNDSRMFPGGCAVGTLSSSARLRLPIQFHYFGIRFYPGAAYPFFPETADRLTDRCIDLEELLGTPGKHLIRQVKQIGKREPDAVTQRIKTVEMFLLNRLEQLRHHDGETENAVHTVISYGGRVSVDQLSDHTYLSSRQLERKFKNKVGVSPKHLCRIMRFRRVLAHLSRCQKPKWAQIAQVYGYYDQAHLTRDFKYFTRLTPAAYLRQQHNPEPGSPMILSDFSNTVTQSPAIIGM